jgi:hypothetical protein
MHALPNPASQPAIASAGIPGVTRDNFSTRVSLENLPQAGAQVFWGDSREGRTIRGDHG